MIMLIVFIVIAIVLWAIGAGIIASDLDQNKPASGPKWLAAFVFGVLGVVSVIVALGWREINAGQVGVVTNFGRVQGTIGPGLTWLPPLINSVVVMDGRVQNYNFGGNPNDAAAPGPGIEAFTRENQVALLYGVVNYHIDPAYAAELYQQVGVDYFEKVIHHQTDTEIKRDSRNYSTDEITAKRDELAAAARVRLQSDVDPFHIIIDGVFISQIGLPPTYLESVNNKLIAEQNIIQRQNEAESARAKAQGEADASVTLAQGQAEANRLISESLTPPVVQWQYIQKLAPNVEIIYLPSDQQVLLPLPNPSPAP